MTTLEQVRKAYEDLSDEDKKTFTQSLKDRVDESVAAQERADGNEDSQTAKDRVDESLGEGAKGLLDRLSKIESYFDGKANGVEEAAEEIYGIGNGVFQGDEKAQDSKRLTGADVKAILNKIKR